MLGALIGMSDWEACRPSALRIGVVDPKYDGERTTRKALMEESEGESEHDEDDESSESQEEGEDEYDSQEDQELGQEEEKDEHESRRENVVEREHDVSADLRKKREDDRRKGKAVSRQIVSVCFAGR